MLLHLAQSLFNLLITLLINRILWPFDQNRSGPKVDLSSKKYNMLELKSISILKAEWIAFGPESGRVEATDLKLDLKSEMTAIQVTVTDAELKGQMEKHQIIIKKNRKINIIY